MFALILLVIVIAYAVLWVGVKQTGDNGCFPFFASLMIFLIAIALVISVFNGQR